MKKNILYLFLGISMLTYAIKDKMKLEVSKIKNDYIIIKVIPRDIKSIQYEYTEEINREKEIKKIKESFRKKMKEKIKEKQNKKIKEGREK